MIDRQVEAPRARQLVPTDKKRSVTRKLLVELLAYQFASPVRWIETQDVLFSGPESIDRLVEIGPANILAGMAKKTIESKYATSDRFQSRSRNILGYSKDSSEIYHEYHESSAPEPSAAPPVDAAATEVKATPAASQPPVQTPVPASSAPVPISIAIEDVAVTAGDVIRALVAQKLKKALEDIPNTKSIKDLSGGKSTLQNEIIGDLGKEFDNMPDSAEDRSLEELGTSLSSNFSGSLGKQSSSLIAKMISSKMPAGFNMAAVREYLQLWGLGPLRQIGVQLIALTAEPPSRLGSVDQAKAFLDTAIQRYAAHSRVTLSMASTGPGLSTSTAPSVDPAALDAIQKDQKEYLRKQMELLAKYLRTDLYSGNEALKSLAESHSEAQKDLDLWNAEHGEVYASGIKPIFDGLKQRLFDSWWNWGRQDVISLYHDVRTGRSRLDDDSIDERCSRIISRAHPSLIDLLKYLTYSPSSSVTCGSIYSNLGRRLIEGCEMALRGPPMFRYTQTTNKPHTILKTNGSVKYVETPRTYNGDSIRYVDLLRQGSTQRFPFVHLRNQIDGEMRYNKKFTSEYLKALQAGAANGISFVGKSVLVTGAGPQSIGAELVQGLISGGAKVIVTTSRQPSSTAQFYQSMYMEYGARESELIVLPFNQGSAQDCEALVKYIYDSTGLGQDLDVIIPFAAIPEAGREIDSLDDRSELAHRLMLVNTLRILGHVKKQKHKRRYNTRPTQVILPLSPNHGTFGGDGLYSESKLGLETLFNRWSSETWGDYLAICGAVIGWTRGTGLMSANNIVAESIEAHGVLTFSQSEMAFNILGLLTPGVSSLCEASPVLADLSGALQQAPNLKGLLSTARASIDEQSEIRKALAKENEITLKVLNGPAASNVPDSLPYRPRANLKFEFPTLPSYERELRQLSNLKGMVDLTRVVVVVGFSELGPLGNSRTRWDVEALGDFSKEGYVEIAWIMGFVKFFDGQIKGQHYAGWVDAKTNQPIHDDDIKDRYGQRIHDHSGIRLIEPELFKGYDPEKKEFLHEIAIDEDLEPFECSKATADAFKLRHGERAEIRENKGSDEFTVKLKKGATLLIPKSIPFDRLVAGQIPTGWDPKKYGVPEDIVSTVDPVTIYALCCVSEALLSAGITDPFEIYRYIHISELGNCIGSGIGGANSLKGMYRDRYVESPAQKDVLQETFINTTGAWINMLLLGGSGPMKTPVGACATALESLDSAVDLIVSGKAKMCLVGGTDDFNEETSCEFANMAATSNSQEEYAKGRVPKEMSRPTASTRSGFMQAQGCGTQIVATAELALEMGLPVYGIIAGTTTASDKIGRSVPAPGQGILTMARETSATYSSPLLDIEYRRNEMEYAISELERWKKIQTEKLQLQKNTDHKYVKHRLEFIEQSAARQMRDIKYQWGNDFARHEPEISPLRAALAVWDLTIDDIDVASFHGTSTKANDKNESDVIAKQLAHLGRTKGNPVLGVFQKSLTGHPLGAAGAWMFNGALQMLNSGLVPGNRNADNVDAYLRRFESIIYPSKTIQTNFIKAISVTSFGFGQKGAQAISVHPRYLFATLEQIAYDDYAIKVARREKQSYLRQNEALMTNSFFRVKKSSPYDDKDESAVYLDPTARISEDKTGKSHFNLDSAAPSIRSAHTSNNTKALSPLKGIEHAQQTITQTLLNDTIQKNPSANITVGVDVEDTNAINISNETFIQRNFTKAEQEYASRAPSPQASFAGRWSAKEAVFKSMHLPSQGAGAPMKDIEILNDKSGVPIVKLDGKAAILAESAGIMGFNVSFSHCDESVVAVALAIR
ncbi:hypothetical protein B7494_g542 [Chlorociboria aeruginascens]|nr:hypothetical protein B7494_g542 [Chlorociboria aeruginascens]